MPSVGMVRMGSVSTTESMPLGMQMSMQSGGMPMAMQSGGMPMGMSMSVSSHPMPM